MGPGALESVLNTLPSFSHPNLIVGFDKSDDAAVYKVNDELAIIQTVDFFPPIVDDAFEFGQIAAANSLSDIYAMGGTPRLALNLFCFPSCLSMDVAREILAGGCDKVLEAGALLCGGHTIEDSEPKYGLCVTGFVHPSKVLLNCGAQVGDALVLTKPLGTGILATAAKAGLLSESEHREMVDIMRTLNALSAADISSVGVNACTDITGFGLVGHTFEMASGSDLCAVVTASSVPVVAAALTMAREGIVPGGAYRNKGHYAPNVASSVPTELVDALVDPQTSGGLLVSLPKEKADELVHRLQKHTNAAIIGEMVPYTTTRVNII